jgi:hypothetical protein
MTGSSAVGVWLSFFDGSASHGHGEKRARSCNDDDPHENHFPRAVTQEIESSVEEDAMEEEGETHNVKRMRFTTKEHSALLPRFGIHHSSPHSVMTTNVGESASSGESMGCLPTRKQPVHPVRAKSAAVEWWKQKPRSSLAAHSEAPENAFCHVCRHPTSQSADHNSSLVMRPNALLAYLVPQQSRDHIHSLRNVLVSGAQCGALADSRLHTTPPAAACCTYCERTVCATCRVECEDCQQLYCSFCSTTDYEHGPTERTVCLECASKGKEVTHSSLEEEDAMQLY